MNIEALLIALGQNVKRLLAFGGRRPKKPAQAAALRPLAATGHEIGGAREHRSRRSWRPTKAFFNPLRDFSDSLRRGVFSETQAVQGHEEGPGLLVTPGVCRVGFEQLLHLF